MSIDPWEGNHQKPSTLHGYNYAEMNPIGHYDPSGFCSQSGWNDTSGIFTKVNCDRLESGDIDFREDWYYSFADYVENVLPETSAHFRHYLDGSGSEFHMPEDFVKNDITTNVDVVQEGLKELIFWYVRDNAEDQNVCEPTSVGPDGYAAGFTPKYIQAHNIIGSWFGDDELDVSGALGSFRFDAVLDGVIHRKAKRWATGELNVHVVVLDIYDWHKGIGVEYEGNSIPDEWAASLADNGLATNFLVRGDYKYRVNVSANLPWLFSVNDDPPDISSSAFTGERASGWFNSSCIGRGFDVGLNEPSGIDYCGDPINLSLELNRNTKLTLRSLANINNLFS